MQKILIISPHQSFNQEAGDLFREQGYEPLAALTGKEGQLKSYQNKCPLIYLDLETKDHAGLEVFRYLKSSQTSNVVFLSSPSKSFLTDNMLNEEKLLRMGAAKVLYAPRPAELPAVVKGLGKIPTAHGDELSRLGMELEVGEEAELQDFEFTRIELKSFNYNSTAATEFYIRLSVNRYVKVVNRGEYASRQQLTKYELSGVRHIYFATKERFSFIHHENEEITVSLKSHDLNPGAIIVASQLVSDKLIEELRAAGIQRHLIEEGKVLFENLFHTAKARPGLGKLLSELESSGGAAMSEAFLVSLFSSIICRHLPWVGDKTLATLGMGALLHDIGKLQLPKELREKSLSCFTSEERGLYEKHPDFGAEALKMIPGVSSSVLMLVQQHHECIDGSGYPARLTNSRIFPLAKILSLSDAFVNHVLTSQCTYLEGLKEFLNCRKNLLKYDSDHIRGLIQGFKR